MAGYIGTKAVALSTTTGNILGDMTVGGTTDVGTLEFNSLSGTGSVTITDILDEDNLASNSATKLATQQSIKAYVDAQVDTVDTLAEILAVGNRTSGTGKIEFRDAAIFINSSADGQLDLVADTEIQLAATTVDINGAVDMSSTLAVGGDITTAADANIIVQGTHNEGGALLDLKGTDTPASGKNLGAVSFGNSSDRSLAMIRGISSATDAADLVFYTEATGASIEERMRISSTGATTFNAGITATSALLTNFLDVRADDAEIYLTNAANNRYFRMQRNNSTADIDIAFFNGSATQEKFSFESAGNFRITDGDVKIGTAGHGIDFSAQTASSASSASITAELLDHYEEGTVGMTLEPGGGSITLESGSDTAFYTRVGRLVTVGGRLEVSSVSSPTGHLYIKGFPFTASFATEQAGLSTASGIVFNPSSNLDGQLAIEITNTHTTSLIVREGGGEAAGVTVMADKIDADSLFAFSVTYVAA